MKNIAEHVISICGGPQRVAEIVGVDVSNVHRWKYLKEKRGSGGIIPAEHQQTLFQFAQKSGIDLKAEDFFSLREE